MSPKSRGQYKVPDPVREMFADPDPERKSEVLQMFAECGYDPEAFAKRYKFTVSKERESELEMPFEFLSKDEMREGKLGMSKTAAKRFRSLAEMLAETSANARLQRTWHRRAAVTHAQRQFEVICVKRAS
eukprot:s6131_g2.t1